MGIIHIYLFRFAGINGMSYHWWSPSALLCKPGKQIYGIYKYMFFKDFGPTNYIIIFNYPRITLEFCNLVFSCFNQTIQWHVLPLACTHSWPIAVESCGKEQFLWQPWRKKRRNSCKPNRLQHRTWSCTQMLDPSGNAAHRCFFSTPKQQGFEKWAEPSSDPLALYFPAPFQINTIHFPHN